MAGIFQMLNEKSIRTIRLDIDWENDFPLSTLNVVLNTKYAKCEQNITVKLDKKNIFLKFFNGRIGSEWDE